jgi:outer membrane protein OmpA-like peptidoglycan-associated protein
MLGSVHAQQPEFTSPSWFFGAAAGANFNFYRGSTQELNSDLTVPTVFHDANGVGLFVAPLIEYHRPNSILGIMLQIGYDNRKASFDKVTTPCNCPADLSADVSYLTVEPSLRVAPFKSNFYLYGGPRLAFDIDKSFKYELGINPAYPNQAATPSVKGDFSNMNKTLISMQVGAGYDIPLSSNKNQTQFILSPFVSFQPYFGQSPRSIETLNLTTLRVGAAFKFGFGHKIQETPISEEAPINVVAVDSDVVFTVNAPLNIPVDRRVRETFPLRNYIFFNLGSTEIPNRYVLLTKDQVKDFKEEQLEVFSPKSLSGRSGREMVVYYNILNILGDRMQKNPSTTITLVGSSEKGHEEGRVMAESVKRYLVDVFAIDASRIKIEGRDKPKIPSEKPTSTGDFALLREGDRRVSIESSSPLLLMEFQSGHDAPLKPVEINAVQEAPIDSYVSFNTKGSKEAFVSWSLEIRDEKENVQYFGPYTDENVSLSGKSILGTRPEGDYKITMRGQTKSGNTIKKETSAHLVLWTPPKKEEAMRYSIIFEFDESKAIGIYQKYLTEIVTPKIPKNGKVIIHGHTDTIGDEVHNKKLSEDRANEAKRIIMSALLKEGRKDVTFEVYGFGKDPNLAPFENKFPEERFYNRTVIIDIIPND